MEIRAEEREERFRTARKAAKKEGLLIGMSSRSILNVALRKAREIGKSRTVVAVLPDGGERYLSPNLCE